MVVYYACNPDRDLNGHVYAAVVAVGDGGKTLAKETYEYDVSEKGKYWGHLRTLRQVLKVVNDLIESHEATSEEMVRIIVPTSIIMLWFEKGKAVEPYRYAFEVLLQECRNMSCDIDFVRELGTCNKAKKYACKEYLPKEELKGFLEVYGDK